MKTNSSCCPTWAKNVFKSKESSFKGILMLLFFMLFFVSGASAQQPACNLKGALQAKFNNSGGQRVQIFSEVAKASPGAVYTWSFKSNTSNATIFSGNGTQSVFVKSGTAKGAYTLELTITNPNGRSCNCSQSISVDNVNAP